MVGSSAGGAYGLCDRGAARTAGRAAYRGTPMVRLAGRLSYLPSLNVLWVCFCYIYSEVAIDAVSSGCTRLAKAELGCTPSCGILLKA